MPQQITGLQMIYLIRRFFQIGDTEETSFELTALMALEYPGDANVGQFKGPWGCMMAHDRTRLSDKG